MKEAFRYNGLADISNNEIEAVVSALSNGHLCTGIVVKEFEKLLSEYIGIVKFNLGKGVIALFPMLYAMIFGVLTKYLKIVNEKDMEDAGSLVSVTLLLLMAKYGTTIGPSFPKIISASPALILQEFGNLGTVLLGVPIALFLGLKRETIELNILVLLFKV